jgi:hypothetical protein
MAAADGYAPQPSHVNPMLQLVGGPAAMPAAAAAGFGGGGGAAAP